MKSAASRPFPLWTAWNGLKRWKHSFLQPCPKKTERYMKCFSPSNRNSNLYLPLHSLYSLPTDRPSVNSSKANPLTSRKIRVSKWIGRKITMKQNITLSIEKNLIKKAKILSAKRQTSISQILSQEMERIVQDSEQYERAKQRATALLRRGFHMGDNTPISREELHERKGLR